MPFAIADIIVTGVVAIVISGTRCAALYWGAGLRNRLCWGFAKEGGSAYLWWWVYLARGGVIIAWPILMGFGTVLRE